MTTHVFKVGDIITPKDCADNRASLPMRALLGQHVVVTGVENTNKTYLHVRSKNGQIGGGWLSKRFTLVASSETEAPKVQEDNMTPGRNYKTTSGQTVYINRVSKCGTYGFYSQNWAPDSEVRIHRKDIVPSVEDLAYSVVASSNAVKSARLEAKLKARLADNNRRLKAIANGVSEPSWWLRAIEVTPVAALAYTGAVGAVCLVSIHLYTYLL